ncbi:MAG TPA: hypothetical protein QGH10_22765, partial [Armatimonadota bacterium]|nr:hypothetical protein [Armatimonadota bacterium]
INEVILISDGEVTAGIEDLGSFARLTADAFDDGVQTTTVGMGLDYDADLMMTVARQGKGNYHFVRDAAAIQEIFKEELEDLTHVVAKALRLRIELADDVELVRVLGSAELTDEEVETVKHTERVQDERIRRELGITADRQDIEDEPGIKIVIPQFYMDDSHVVMLEIEVPKGSKERKIADVHLKYKDLVFAKNQDVTITATVQPAASEDVMLASTSQAVKKNVLGFQTGEALQKAAMFIDVGDYGKAAKVVDEQMVVLGVASEGWKDPDLDKDGALLAKYVSVIGSMNSQYSGDRELGVYLAKSLTYSAYQRTR